MGHEYIANEAYDAALESFRHSVSVDRRAYSGWYGLGKVYQCMGKMEDAERHYRIAANINPSNSTLLVCIGVVLERLRNRKGALANFSRALELAPGSALARFKKARVLMHMKFYGDALEELDLLRNQAPDEANVWFLLGKCFKGLGERGEALRAFTTALNLDVKVCFPRLVLWVLLLTDLRRRLSSKKLWRLLMRRMRRAMMSDGELARTDHSMSAMSVGPWALGLG
jgi:anaphase-promoting complex subunit 3